MLHLSPLSTTRLQVLLNLTIFSNLLINNAVFRIIFSQSLDVSLFYTVPVAAPAVCSRRTGANRDEPWRNSSAFIHFRQCYGPDPVLSKMWSRSVPILLRFVTVHSRRSPGHRRQSPGVTTASQGSRTAKPGVTRCEYQWSYGGTYNRHVICKVQNLSYIPRQKRTAIRVGENHISKHGLNTVSVLVQSASTGLYRSQTDTPP